MRFQGSNATAPRSGARSLAFVPRQSRAGAVLDVLRGPQPSAVILETHSVLATKPRAFTLHPWLRSRSRRASFSNQALTAGLLKGFKPFRGYSRARVMDTHVFPSKKSVLTLCPGGTAVVALFDAYPSPRGLRTPFCRSMPVLLNLSPFSAISASPPTGAAVPAAVRGPAAVGGGDIRGAVLAGDAAAPARQTHFLRLLQQSNRSKGNYALGT